MNDRLQYCRTLVLASFALIFLLVVPSVAEEAAKPAPAANWRPKDGTYADLAGDFTTRCGEYGDLIVELSEKSVGGNELQCKVNKLTDTAPNAIRLDITCNDYNLAEQINDPNPYERKFKEIMLLKKIDEKTVSVRRTLNGKFSAPPWRASFCPDGAQRMYQEGKRRSKKEANGVQAAGKTATPAVPWNPKEGVYAGVDANFNDQCTKSGALVLGLTQGDIASGADKCRIFQRTNSPPDAILVNMICNGKPGAETMILKKIDDSTIMLQKTKNGKFSEPEKRVSYCPEEAQRMYKAAAGPDGKEQKARE